MAEALSGAGSRPAQVDGWTGRSGTCPTALQRRICFDGRSGEISVRPVRGRNCLELQIDFPEPAALLRIVTRVRRVFDLDADPAAIATHLGSDPRLKPLLRRWPGLRVPGDWEDTVSADDPWHAYRAMYLWKETLERKNELLLSGNTDRSAPDCRRPELRPAH
jgi:AlkA-like protein